MRRKYDDDTLREAFVALARTPRSRQGCPAPERLWAAIRREVEVAERLELVEHTTTCPACAEIWRMATLMGARPPARWRLFIDGIARRSADALAWLRRSVAIPGLGGGDRSMHWNLGALASTAGALALVVAFLAQPTQAPRYREASTHRGEIQARTAADIPVDPEGFLLQWSAPEGALLYDLKIMNEALEPVVMVEGLEDPKYELSKEELAGLDSGEHLFWRVEAVLANGDRVASSTFISRLQ